MGFSLVAILDSRSWSFDCGFLFFLLVPESSVFLLVPDSSVPKNGKSLVILVSRGGERRGRGDGQHEPGTVPRP